MSDIFPAEGQSVSDVIADLTKLGLTDGTDVRTHWTWDMRPYVKAEPDAYKKWQSKHGGDAADKADNKASEADESKTADDDKDTKSDSESSDDKGSTSRKRGGK